MEPFWGGGIDHYGRQLGLWGFEGQQRLQQANVMIAGCGGLGSVIATYLACAGVGVLRLVDCDRVDLSNLNRQFLHWHRDIGKLKSTSFKEKLTNLNPKVTVEEIHFRIDDDRVGEMISGMDLIADALDN